jgi:hypothetical protein
MDIVDYNARWLAAWSAKDTAALLTFYGPNIVYKDAQVAAGITGHTALGAYLNALFAATPAMEYVPEETWPIPGGFCGRWNCRFTQPDGKQRHLRGFDLVLLDGDQIIHNEVYTHDVPV